MNYLVLSHLGFIIIHSAPFQGLHIKILYQIDIHKSFISSGVMTFFASRHVLREGPYPSSRALPSYFGNVVVIEPE